MEDLTKSKHVSNGAYHANLVRFNELSTFAQSVYDTNPLNPPQSIMDLHNPEVRSLLDSLHQHKVKYMLVGGVATVFHGYVRTTQDLDLWVQETNQNKQRLVQALQAIDVPGATNCQSVEMIPGWSTITIGTQGFVADFMGYTKAFGKGDFDECYQRAERAIFAEIPITVIYLDDLIKEKKALGRLKDLDDVQHLEEITNKRRP